MTQDRFRILMLRAGAHAGRSQMSHGAQGLHCVAYSPLGQGNGGLLTLPEVLKVAEETGRPPTQARRPCLLLGNRRQAVPCRTEMLSESNTCSAVTAVAASCFWECRALRYGACGGMSCTCGPGKLLYWPYLHARKALSRCSSRLLSMKP